MQFLRAAGSRIADNVSTETRTRTMRKVRSRDTKLERAFRQALIAQGLRGYRVAPSNVVGKPDVVYLRAKFAIFVDSCFWHGCPDHCRRPSSNVEYWNSKITRNKARDERVSTSLAEQGWTILRIWEHDLRENPASVVQQITTTLAQLRVARPVRLIKAGD
jgi:DNA mismatch endonuclease (patch repair protein)